MFAWVASRCGAVEFAGGPKNIGVNNRVSLFSELKHRNALWVDKRCQDTNDDNDDHQLHHCYATHVSMVFGISAIFSSNDYSMPFCVQTVLTGRLTKPGLKHSTPIHAIGGGAQSAPVQSRSSGLGNRNTGEGAIPPCASSVIRSVSASAGSSVSKLFTTGSPFSTLTWYRKFLPWLG